MILSHSLSLWSGRFQVGKIPLITLPDARGGPWKGGSVATLSFASTARRRSYIYWRASAVGGLSNALLPSALYSSPPAPQLLATNSPPSNNALPIWPQS